VSVPVKIVLTPYLKWPKKVVEITAASRYIGPTLHSSVLCCLAIEVAGCRLSAIGCRPEELPAES